MRVNSAIKSLDPNLLQPMRTQALGGLHLNEQTLGGELRQILFHNHQEGRASERLLANEVQSLRQPELVLEHKHQLPCAKIFDMCVSTIEVQWRLSERNQETRQMLYHASTPIKPATVIRPEGAFFS